MYERGDFFNSRGVNSPTSPERVGKAILHALTSRFPRTHYHVGIDAKVLNLAQACLPIGGLDRIIARLMGVLHRLD